MNVVCMLAIMLDNVAMITPIQSIILVPNLMLRLYPRRMVSPMQNMESGAPIGA